MIRTASGKSYSLVKKNFIISPQFLFSAIGTQCFGVFSACSGDLRSYP
jgi:hypothetical protein